MAYEFENAIVLDLTRVVDVFSKPSRTE